MKSVLLLAMFLGATSASADVYYQIKHVIGDWDCGPDSSVLRIRKMDDFDIKVYRCDRSRYLRSNGFCSYDKIFIDKFNFGFGGFCGTSGRYFCSTGLKVSQQYPDELLEITDPLLRYDWGKSGSVAVECRKL